jgi:hypothetical protein
VSNQNRVRSGVPTGGEFAAVSHAEAGIALADPAARPVYLAPGEDENINELADGEVIESIDVRRSHVDDSSYVVSARNTVNIHFIRDRYEADLDNQDYEEVRVECSTSLPDAPLAEGAVTGAAGTPPRSSPCTMKATPGHVRARIRGPAHP